MCARLSRSLARASRARDADRVHGDARARASALAASRATLAARATDDARGRLPARAYGSSSRSTTVKTVERGGATSARAVEITIVDDGASREVDRGLTPAGAVELLDRHIVGQRDASGRAPSRCEIDGEGIRSRNR